MAADPVEIARRLHAALESGAHGEALRPLFAPDATTIEHPHALRPTGATTSLEEMLAASSAGAGMLSSQRYELRHAVADGTRAALAMRWTGVIATDVGPFRAGQELVADIAQFVETDGARIRSIETFDCYLPFA